MNTGLNVADALLDVVIPPRTPWSHVLRRGQTMRLIDIEGQQAVDALFYAADDTAQRYSAQDTVREQGSRWIGEQNSLTTKCPSKYQAASSSY